MCDLDGWILSFLSPCIFLSWCWPTYRSTCVMAAVTSASDLLAAPSKRSRGLADIDPKFVSNVNKNFSLRTMILISLLFISFFFLTCAWRESCRGNTALIVITFNECGHPFFPDFPIIFSSSFSFVSSSGYGTWSHVMTPTLFCYWLLSAATAAV